MRNDKRQDESGKGEGKSSARRFCEALLAVAVISIVVLFFWRELGRNWGAFKGLKSELRYPYLAAAFLSILASYLVSTQAWRYGVNQFAKKARFSFSESVGMVNTTQLTKYVPGKVWGYAMQMALVDRNSFPASVVLYVNIFIALTNVFIYLLAGGVYFASSSALLPRGVSVGLTAALASVYLFFLVFNGKFFALLLRLFRKIFRRSVEFHEIELPRILKLQAISVLSAFLFGAAAALCCLGLGFAMTPRLAYSAVSGFLFSDAAGFLMFFVPGGIGVREGLLYLVLKEAGAESIALILPIALRLTSMLVDAILGLIGLVYLNNYKKKDAK
jgi:uncharacterized membrane protein YbhN (UPF0104 family)